MFKYFGITLNKEKKIEILYYILFIFFIFSTEALMIIPLLLLIYLYFKDKDKDKDKLIYEILKKAIVCKFFISLIIKYGNMRKESLRLIFLIFIIEFIYRKGKIKIKENFLAFSLVIWFLLGIFWSYMSFGGVKSLKLFAEENIYLLLPFIFLNILDKKDKIYEILKNSLSLVVLGIFIEIKINKFGLNNILYIYKGNLISIFSVILPFLFFEIIQSKQTITKIIKLLIFILGCFIVVQAGARGALFGVLLAIIISLIISFRWKGIFAAGILFIFSFVIIKTNPKLENQFFKVKDFSTRSRYYLMDAGIYTFEKNIIFGSGRGNTQKYFIEYSDSDKLDLNKFTKNNYEKNAVKNYYLKCFPDTHNIFIDFLAEYGILGVLIDILIGLIIPSYIVLEYFKTKDREFIKCFSGIIGFLISGLSWSIWTQHGRGVPYFIMLIYFFTNEKKRLENESNSSSRRNRE